MNLSEQTSLAGLGFTEVGLALMISLALTATCITVIALCARRQPARHVAEVDNFGHINHAVFIFDEQRMISAPRDWREAMDDSGLEGSDWERLHLMLSQRFPGMPELPELPEGETFRIYSATLADDDAVLRIRQVGTRLRITVRENGPGGLSDRHKARLDQIRLKRLQQAVEKISIPVWSMDFDGRILEENPAFTALRQQQTGAHDITAPLLRGSETEHDQPDFTYRVMLDPRGRSPERWYDVSAHRHQGGWHCAAQDMTALVRAELAQRNFVQTLTKTFAQLSTGLAIFDRDRQLILFNPSLVDLTSLSPEFLTSRPTLIHFFDNLRDRQIMPEPKNYASWREQLSALVSAAADGRYQETWSLSSGATYRVTGRPHPNGAVAFLFEDITDEILMTRRFRQQLSLSQSVLDAISDAIVIFDAQGIMSYCNSSYRHLFQIKENADLSEVSIQDAHRMWARRASALGDLDQVLARLTSRREKRAEASEYTLALRGVGEVPCRVQTLVAGACMVSIGPLRDVALVPEAEQRKLGHVPGKRPGSTPQETAAE